MEGRGEERGGVERGVERGDKKGEKGRVGQSRAYLPPVSVSAVSPPAIPVAVPVPVSFSVSVVPSTPFISASTTPFRTVKC